MKRIEKNDQNIAISCRLFFRNLMTDKKGFYIVIHIVMM